jgi:GDP-L-fucose synthase
MKEDMLLTGPLEPTNEAYAVAKIAGIKLCQAYKTQYGFNAICAQPTNLYGPNDNFSNTQSHVLPALVRRIVEAKENNLGKIVCWGTGTPTREFLYVDDLAEACVFLMNNYDGKDIVNVGTGKEISIAGLVSAICKAVGWEGDIEWDSSKPDGTPRKVCDVSSLANMGWVAKTDLEQGIRQTVDWYLMNRENARK